MNKPINVYIVDDDDAVRDSLAMLLEAAGYAVVTFASAVEFIAYYAPGIFGCVILDVDMPGMDGLELQEKLTQCGVCIPVIFLTGHGTIPATVRAIQAGAVDFLTKPVNGSVLLACVHNALEQCTVQQEQEETYRSITSRLAKLSKREREVMALAVAGHTSKEIAQRLAISFRTVEIHRAHIMQKTGASNLLELARITTVIESNRTS